MCMFGVCTLLKGLFTVLCHAATLLSSRFVADLSLRLFSVYEAHAPTKHGLLRFFFLTECLLLACSYNLEMYFDLLVYL